MKIKYKHTKEDIEKALLTLENIKDNIVQVATNRLKIMYVLMGALVCKGIFLEIKYQGGIQYNIFLLIGGAFIARTLWSGKKMYIKEQEKACLAKQKMKRGDMVSIFKETTITTDETNFIIEKEDEKSKFSLLDLKWVREDSKMLYLKLTTARNEIIIPKHAFESEEEKDKFITLITKENDTEYVMVESYEKVVMERWENPFKKIAATAIVIGLMMSIFM